MSKKKTHKEYVEELKIKNPNVEVVGIYCGANIKIPHRCKNDGTIWDISPSNALQGYSCPKCATTKKSDKLSMTHDEYVIRLKKKNSNIEVLETYAGSKTKILHRCKNDGHEWKVAPGNILSGTGCPLCAGTIKKTHEKYVTELSELNPNIKVIGEYKNAKTNILHYCLVHDEYFETSPTNLLQGKTGCYFCSNEKRRIAMAMSKEEYVKRLHEISHYIDIIGEYVNMSTKSLHYCNKHNIEFEIAPEHALHGRGCSECKKEKIHKSRTRTTEDYISLVKNINPNIEVLGEYISNHTPILHRCKKHNIKWNVVPYVILQGSGCKQCGKEKLAETKRKTHKQYVSELEIINPDIEVIEHYIDSNTPILHKCRIDDYEWKARPANLLIGRNCPVCSESKGERKVRQWLEKNHFDYIYQYKYEDCKDINQLPFDFYLPTFNYLIEYDGEQHYYPIEYFGGQEKFELQQKHDNIKNEYCKKYGIPLLRIPYFKFDNIEEELNNFLFI